MIGPPGPGRSTAARPRPSGGFSQGFGNFSDEHLDESAMQKAMQGKALQQQMTSTPTKPGGANPLAQAQGEQKQPPKPRELGSFAEELVKRPFQDVVSGLKSLFDINSLLGIGSSDTPEQQAQKQQFHQRYQQMTEEEKQVAQRRYQMEMQKKKQEQEEEQMRRQQQQQQSKSMVVPSSPKKGPVGPASGKSKKSNAAAMLEQDRKTLGNTGKKF